MSEYLLIDGTQIPVTSELAQVIGLNEAIVLQEVYYWCKVNRREKRTPHDGYYWVYNSYRGWKEKHFPWWSESTIRRTFERLEAKNLLVTGNYNKSKMDQTKWYRVNFPVLAATIQASPFAQNEQMDLSGLSKPIPEDNTEGNKIKMRMGFAGAAPTKPLHPLVAEMGNEEIDLDKFIEWYRMAYKEVIGQFHPKIKADQQQRIKEELTKFMENPEYAPIDTGDLQVMAMDFFDTVDSNDWRINHFATPGILERRFYQVIK